MGHLTHGVPQPRGHGTAQTAHRDYHLGFQSDEATYYMMGHSLARDGDLTYRLETSLGRDAAIRIAESIE